MEENPHRNKCPLCEHWQRETEADGTDMGICHESPHLMFPIQETSIGPGAVLVAQPTALVPALMPPILHPRVKTNGDFAELRGYVIVAVPTRTAGTYGCGRFSPRHGILAVLRRSIAAVRRFVRAWFAPVRPG